MNDICLIEIHNQAKCNLTILRIIENIYPELYYKYHHSENLKFKFSLYIYPKTSYFHIHIQTHSRTHLFQLDLIKNSLYTFIEIERCYSFQNQIQKRSYQRSLFACQNWELAMSCSSLPVEKIYNLIMQTIKHTSERIICPISNVYRACENSTCLGRFLMTKGIVSDVSKRKKYNC